ncbi:MAG: MBL fold metallo-hydrolase, partial [Pseudomonadales bacterium]
MVVDPGGDPDKLIENIDALELSIESVVLTHGHLDHVGASKALSAYYNVPIIGPHVADKFWIDALDQQCQMFGFPPTESFSPDRWLEEGETVSFGDEQLEVLHCPGHTPGHIVLFNRKAKLLQVGDVLFQGSIGRTDFPHGDHSALVASIKNKLLPLGDDVSFIPG